MEDQGSPSGLPGFCHGFPDGGPDAAALPGHRTINHRLHQVLDVTFDEDRARNRRDNGPENLAILRRLTLNLLNKARPRMSAARKRKRSGWSDAFARTIIGQMR